jgi:hypothetical protein
LAEAREEFCWLKPEAICLRTPAGEDRTEIWTYAGQNVNAAISNGLSHVAGKQATVDNFRLRINELVSADLVHQWFSEMRKLGPLPPAIRDLSALLERLKFRQCLPDRLAERMISLRSTPGPEGMAPLEEPIVFVHWKKEP